MLARASARVLAGDVDSLESEASKILENWNTDC